MTLQERINTALEFAAFGQADGAHHKAWAIDQMVRALTDCPIVQKTAIDGTGKQYAYQAFGESDAYMAFVAAHKAGADGPDTYEWDEGRAP